VYVAFHFVHIFSLGLRSSQASSVRGYISEAMVEVAAMATRVESAIGTLARCAFSGHLQVC